MRLPQSYEFINLSLEQDEDQKKVKTGLFVEESRKLCRKEEWTIKDEDEFKTMHIKLKQSKHNISEEDTGVSHHNNKRRVKCLWCLNFDHIIKFIQKIQIVLNLKRKIKEVDHVVFYEWKTMRKFDKAVLNTRKEKLTNFTKTSSSVEVVNRDNLDDIWKEHVVLEPRKNVGQHLIVKMSHFFLI